MGQTNQKQDTFWSLVKTAQQLHAPDGCPWDRSQTLRSLLPHLIEETWEVFEAIYSDDLDGLEEELGDVLYTVLFLALIAQKQGRCDLDKILKNTRKKMIRRHPHVFGVKKAHNPKEAYQSWQAIKAKEKPKRHSPSKNFRLMLLRYWEWLHENPEVQSDKRYSPMSTKSKSQKSRINATPKKTSGKTRKSKVR